MFKLLIPFLLTVELFSVTLNNKFINNTYKSLSKHQIDVIKESYNIGQTLIIDGEKYGHTLATFVLLESSAGVFLTGDDGESVGLTQISYIRTVELLEGDELYSYLLSYPKEELMNIVKVNGYLNLYLAKKNFMLQLKRWKSYSKAVKAHNGYNPYKGFYNMNYYTKFVNLMQVVKRVIENSKKSDSVNNLSFGKL